MGGGEKRGGKIAVSCRLLVCAHTPSTQPRPPLSPTLYHPTYATRIRILPVHAALRLTAQKPCQDMARGQEGKIEARRVISRV